MSQKPTSNKPKPAKSDKSSPRGLRKYTSLVLPIAAAIIPFLKIFVANQNQLYFYQMYRPLLVNLLLAAALFYLAWLLYKNINKASILSAATLLVLTYFVGLRDGIEDSLGLFGIKLGWLNLHNTLLLFVALLLALGYRLYKSRGDWRMTTDVLAIIVVVQILAGTVSIVGYHSKNSNFNSRTTTSPLSTASSKAPAAKPDIYYIILDRYASQETLSSQFKFDNQDFLSYLQGKGFSLANTAHANYPFTIQSIASSLNGEYLPTLSPQEQNTTTSTHLLQDMINQNGAARFAEHQGYNFTQIGSWWDPTRSNPDSYSNLHSPREVRILGAHIAISDYEAVLVRQSILQLKMGETIKVAGKVVFSLVTVDAEKLHAQSGLYELDQLGKQASVSDKPKFVFAHILLPHPPFVFDQNGNWARTNPHLTQKELYLAQMNYTNTKMKQVLDTLTADKSHQPVIILQADEGPYPTRFDRHTTTFDWNKATPAELQEKTGILSAYYLPGVDSSAIYPGISPVNSFRLVFSKYFGANLPYLDDKHYIDNASTPYKFIDLTDKLN